MKLKDELNARNIFNEHNLLSTLGSKDDRDVVCSFAGSSGRGLGSMTRVWSPFFKTNPKDAAWYDNGNKSFSGDMSYSLPEAVAWATEKYGITEWATSPFGRGAKIPARILAKAKEYVKQTPPTRQA